MSSIGIRNDQRVEAYQISGETKLKTWKLRNFVSSAVLPVELKPITRRTNAVMKRASVRRFTKFQNVNERQDAKRSSLKVCYEGQVRQGNVECAVMNQP